MSLDPFSNPLPPPYAPHVQPPQSLNHTQASGLSHVFVIMSGEQTPRIISAHATEKSALHMLEPGQTIAMVPFYGGRTRAAIPLPFGIDILL